MSKNAATLESLAGRFTVKDGENDMEALVQSLLVQCRASLLNVKQTKELHEKALAFLKRFAFKTDPRKVKAFSGVLSPTTSNWIFMP